MHLVSVITNVITAVICRYYYTLNVFRQQLCLNECRIRTAMSNGGVADANLCMNTCRTTINGWNCDDRGIKDNQPSSPELNSLLHSFRHTKQVGGYLIGRTIGEGSFAKVKEGLHVITGEKVPTVKLPLYKQ